MLALNSWFCCLCLLSIRIAGMCHQTQLVILFHFLNVVSRRWGNPKCHSSVKPTLSLDIHSVTAYWDLLRQRLNASIAKIPSAQPTNLCALEGLRWLLTRLEDTPGLLFSVTEKLKSCSPCPATLGSQHTLSLLRRKPCIPQVSVWFIIVISLLSKSPFNSEMSPEKLLPARL